MLANATDSSAPSQNPDAEVRALIKFAEDNFAKQPTEARQALESAKQVLLKHPNQKFYYEILSMECWIQADKDVNLARINVESLLSSIDREQFAEEFAQLKLCWGFTSELTGNLNEAAEAYAFGVSEGRRLEAKELLADALGSQGDLKSYRGEHSEALENLKESYDIYQSLADEHAMRFTLNSIANVYSRLNEHSQAIRYYQQLLAHEETHGTPSGVAVTRYNIGRAEELQGALKEARRQFELAIQLAESTGDVFTIAIARRSLANIMVSEGQAQQALPILNETIAFYERHKDPQMIALTRLTRGSAFRKLNQHKAALIDLNLALDEFVASQNLRGIADAELERANTYEAEGNYHHAYQALKEYLEAHNTLDNNMREEHTTRMRVHFDSEQKERENSALLREKTLQEQQLNDSKRIRWLQSLTLVLTFILVIILMALVGRHVRNSRRLSALALTDELTRLANRRSILAFGEQLIAQAKRYRSPFTILVLDIDYFKRINDTYGHSGGDVVLQKIAAVCVEELREGDHIGRTGGEEFMAILPMTEYRSALDVAERLRVAIANISYADINPKMQVTISIGVAQWRDSDDNMSLITQRADDALYRAKANGRNKVELAD